MTSTATPIVWTDRRPTWAEEANQVARRSGDGYIVLAVSSQKAGAAPTPPIAGRRASGPACCPRNIEKRLLAEQTTPLYEALAPMIDWLESDRQLAAVTAALKGADGAQQMTLAPHPHMAVLRCKALLEAGGFDVNYWGWGESLDLGWRWWLMGYTVGQLALAEEKNVDDPISYLTSEQRYTLMRRNWLWTIIKNRQESHLGQELSLALLDVLATAYRQAQPDIIELPVQSASAQPGWKQRLLNWLDPLRTAPRLHCYDADVPLARAPRQLVAALVMANDIIEAMPVLIQVRQQVQARRTRSDDEIEQQLGLELPACIRRGFLRSGD